MKINFIPFSEIEKKQLIEYMFEKLDVISVNNDSPNTLLPDMTVKSIYVNTVMKKLQKLLF